MFPSFQTLYDPRFLDWFFIIFNFYSSNVIRQQKPETITNKIPNTSPALLHLGSTGSGKTKLCGLKSTKAFLMNKASPQNIQGFKKKWDIHQLDATSVSEKSGKEALAAWENLVLKPIWPSWATSWRKMVKFFSELHISCHIYARE